ncbi:MAG TPA: sugar phosphate isomerase/epimerase [Polyangiaceae bacterium]
MTTLGLQLYTVREQLGKDFTGTLRDVSRAGYAAVEGGPGRGMTPADYKALCEELGLAPIATGSGLEGLEGDLSKTLERAAASGARYIMLGWVPPKRRKTSADWAALARDMNQWGRAARDSGLIFQYHNHDIEFVPVDGSTGLEIILSETDPDLVKFEVDVGWVTWAGGQPAELLMRMGRDRVRIIHLKDCHVAPSKAWTEVGTGALDLAGVAAACRELEVEYAMIEQDTCILPPIESIAISLANAKRAFGAMG